MKKTLTGRGSNPGQVAKTNHNGFSSLALKNVPCQTRQHIPLREIATEPESTIRARRRLELSVIRSFEGRKFSTARLLSLIKRKVKDAPTIHQLDHDLQILSLGHRVRAVGWGWRERR